MNEQEVMEDTGEMFENMAIMNANKVVDEMAEDVDDEMTSGCREKVDGEVQFELGDID